MLRKPSPKKPKKPSIHKPSINDRVPNKKQTLRSIAAGIINKIRERLDRYEVRGFDTEELRKEINLGKLETRKRFTQKDVNEIKRKSSSNFMRTKVQVRDSEGEWVTGLKAFKYIRERDEVRKLSTADEIGIRLDNIEDNMPYIKASDLERKDVKEQEQDTSWVEELWRQKEEKWANEYIDEISKPTRVWQGKEYFEEPSIFYTLFTELRDQIGDEQFNKFIKENEDKWKEITENFYELSYYKDTAGKLFSAMVAKMPEEFRANLKNYRVKTEDTIAPDQGQLIKPETSFAKAWEESNAFKALGADSTP